MNGTSTTLRTGRRWCSSVIMVSLVLAAPATAAATAGSSRSVVDGADAAADLPAMALTPADLAAVGHPGAYVLSGETLNDVSVGGLADEIGEWTDQVVNDEIHATLEASGLVRGYHFGLRVRAEPDDFESEAARDVYGSVFEFASPQGAGDAVGLFRELSSASTLGRFVDAAAIGDGSLVIQGASSEEENLDELVLAFHRGPIVAVVQIVDYEAEGAAPAPDALADLEAVATRLLDRVGRVLGGDAPGLGNRMLRVVDDEYGDLFELRLDQYLRIAGADLEFLTADPGTLAAVAEAAGDATDVYALNEFVQDTGIDSLPDQFGFGLRLYRFVDEPSASAWFAARSTEPVEDSGSGIEITDLEPLPELPTFGDESSAFTYVENTSFPGRVVRVQMRVGDTVADLLINSFLEDPAPPAALEGLATAQVTCLTDGCTEPVLLSDAIAGRAIPSTVPTTTVAPLTVPSPTVPSATTATTSIASAPPGVTSTLPGSAEGPDVTKPSLVVPGAPTTTVPDPSATGPLDPGSQVPPVPPGFTRLVDDTGTITVVVPSTWSDVDTTPGQNDDGTTRPYIGAATDFGVYQKTFDAPGVEFVMLPFDPDPQRVMDDFGLTGGCATTSSSPFDDGVFTGLHGIWSQCGSGAAEWHLIVANPADQSFTLLLLIQITGPSDQAALQTIITTFDLTSPRRSS